MRYAARLNSFLLVVSAKQVQRFTVERNEPAALPVMGKATVVLSKGLEAPHTLAINAAGNELFVADWGTSHQVKVFSPDGRFVRRAVRRCAAQ